MVDRHGQPDPQGGEDAVCRPGGNYRGECPCLAEWKEHRIDDEIAEADGEADSNTEGYAARATAAQGERDTEKRHDQGGKG